jgi:hypothetical protein
VDSLIGNIQMKTYVFQTINEIWTEPLYFQTNDHDKNSIGDK